MIKQENIGDDSRFRTGPLRISTVAYDYNPQEGHVGGGEIGWKTEQTMPKPSSVEED